MDFVHVNQCNIKSIPTNSIYEYSHILQRIPTFKMKYNHHINCTKSQLYLYQTRISQFFFCVENGISFVKVNNQFKVHLIISKSLNHFCSNSGKLSDRLVEIWSRHTSYSRLLRMTRKIALRAQNGGWAGAMLQCMAGESKKKDKSSK